MITGVAARCDWVVLSDKKAPHVHLVRNVDTPSPRWVFLSMRSPFEALRFFAENVLPLLISDFVLVSGSGDITIPLQIDQRFRSYTEQEAEYIERILAHPGLRIWFAENLDDDQHLKFFPMPVGMLFKGGKYPEGAVAQLVPPSSSRRFRVLCAHRVRGGPQWQSRRLVTELARGAWGDFCTVIDDEIPEADYIALLRQHAFVLCVEGGGLDPSPKAWQAIMNGAVPIIRRTSLYRAYQQLPVGFVSRWTADEISVERLTEWRQQVGVLHDTLQSREEVLRRLGSAYWWDQVTSVPLARPT